MMRRPLGRLFGLFAWLALCPFLAAPAAYGEPFFAVSVERPFRREINRDMARQAALAAARLQAAQKAASYLAELKDVRPLLDEEPPDSQLAAALGFFLLEKAAGDLAEEKIGGAPPDFTLKLNLIFTLRDPESLRRELTRLFTTRPLLENCKLAIRRQAGLLAAYDAASHVFLAMPDKESPERAAALENVRKLHDGLRAIQLYLDILPDLYAGDRLSPALLESMEEINRLLPDNYLFLCELGRLYLWLERNGQAGLALEASRNLNPEFAQTYAHRAALWLFLHKPSLALADFDRAIRLMEKQPTGQADYYYGRAVVWQALGNTEAMCADLRQSCLLGQCEAYEWAGANGECRPQ